MVENEDVGSEPAVIPRPVEMVVGRTVEPSALKFQANWPDEPRKMVKLW